MVLYLSTLMVRSGMDSVTNFTSFFMLVKQNQFIHVVQANFGLS